MRYSVFAGGKRIRPILCLEAARAVAGADPEGIYDVACSLELIHTYSLIHDDLPALDNDDLRRGRPTSHKVFGEAMAILAGDALLTFAFEVLARAASAALVAELARAAGTVGGMIAGQVHDIEGEKLAPSAGLLERIHRAKTGALLRCSLRLGAMHAGASPAQLDALSRYGEHIRSRFPDRRRHPRRHPDLRSSWARPRAKTPPSTRSPSRPSTAWKRAAHAWPRGQRRAGAPGAGVRSATAALRLRQLADLIVERSS